MLMGNELDALDALDRDAVMEHFAQELPGIRKTLNVKIEELADKTGMDAEKLKDVEKFRQNLKWSEYMSLLFIIWNNDEGRAILETRGLFPEALKKAMSTNRKAHPPITESTRLGL